jgi:hypothetical protein
MLFPWSPDGIQKGLMGFAFKSLTLLQTIGQMLIAGNSARGGAYGYSCCSYSVFHLKVG